jgi:hypothetical protein
MKTVRLSRTLKWDISRAADKKFEAANPTKNYPDAGYEVLVNNKIIEKTEKTKAIWKEIWGTDMQLSRCTEVRLSAKWQTEPDEDDYQKEEYRSYTLSIPPVELPHFMCSYGDVVKIDVGPTDPVLIQCMAVEDYNSKLEGQKRDQRNSVEGVMRRFSTLNQLMKAAPYIKDLVPQDKITKMHEVDDRSGRRAELAEIADEELQGLRETLLEDSLLGDD